MTKRQQRWLGYGLLAWPICAMSGLLWYVDPWLFGLVLGVCAAFVSIKIGIDFLLAAEQ